MPIPGLAGRTCIFSSVLLEWNLHLAVVHRVHARKSAVVIVVAANLAVNSWVDDGAHWLPRCTSIVPSLLFPSLPLSLAGPAGPIRNGSAGLRCPTLFTRQLDSGGRWTNTNLQTLGLRCSNRFQTSEPRGPCLPCQAVHPHRDEPWPGAATAFPPPCPPSRSRSCPSWAPSREDRDYLTARPRTAMCALRPGKEYPSGHSVYRPKMSHLRRGDVEGDSNMCLV